MVKTMNHIILLSADRHTDCFSSQVGCFIHTARLTIVLRRVRLRVMTQIELTPQRVIRKLWSVYICSVELIWDCSGDDFLVSTDYVGLCGFDVQDRLLCNTCN